MSVITRTVLVLSLVSLFADIASELLYPVIPVFLEDIGFSILAIGLLEGIAGFTAGISKGYFGKLSDARGSRLPFVKLGYLLSAVSKPMMAVSIFPPWIFLTRTIDRLGKGVRTAARDALLSSESTPATKARVFGFHRALDTAGATLGPALALVFLWIYPGRYQVIFLLAFIPGLISVLLIFLLKEKKKPVSNLQAGSFFSFLKYYRVATPEYRRLVTGLLLFALFNSSDIFLLLKTKELTGDDRIAIGAYVFYNLVYAICSYPLGKLADRVGFRAVFGVGLVLFAIVYAGFAFNHSSVMVFILFFVYGIYAAATEGVARAWITNLAQDKNMGTAIGFYSSAESICSLAASVVAGFLWTEFGSAFTFLTASVAALFVLCYFSIYGSRITNKLR